MIPFRLLYVTSLVVFLLLGTTSELSAQKIKKFNKNKVGLFYSVNHYFDGTATNWTVLVPTSVYSDSGKKVLPPTFGLFYSRTLDSTRAITISVMTYHRYHPYPRDLPFGQVVGRRFNQLGIGYNHHLFLWNNQRVSAVSELNFRHGYETIHISYPNWFEAYAEAVPLRDLGLGFGLQYEIKLPLNLSLTFETKYCHFVHLRNTTIEFNSKSVNATNNNLTFAVGLSYGF